MQRVTVRLDSVQLAWLDAIADLHGCSRAAVLRHAVLYLAAKESERVQRHARYAVIAEIAKAERWDPVTDYLARWQGRA